MALGRPKALLELTSEESEQLGRWARRRKFSLALRSRIVLACAQGYPNTEVAARLGISKPTVGKWRSRFVKARLDGLVDDPRAGRPATVTAEQVEDIVVATLESTPDHATHWSRSKDEEDVTFEAHNVFEATGEHLVYVETLAFRDAGRITGDLNTAGFIVAQIWGSWSQRRPSPDSNLLVFEAARPGSDNNG